MSILNQPIYDRHPHDEPFDRVRLIGMDGQAVVSIITALRYKTSGLSGDEWRISGQIHIANEDPSAPLSVYRNVETSCQALFCCLYYHRRPLLETMIRTTVFEKQGSIVYGIDDEGKASTLLVAAAGLPWGWNIACDEYLQRKDWTDYCFQPGCARKAVSTYKLKEQFSLQGEGPLPPVSWPVLRRFCKLHLRRGDCGRSDADANYEVIEGPGPDDRDSAADEFNRESIFGGVINLGGEKNAPGPGGPP